MQVRYAEEGYNVGMFQEFPENDPPGEKPVVRIMTYVSTRGAVAFTRLTFCT